MFPKKKYYDGSKWSGQIELNKGFNQCHDLFTQEIKKRADVERLAEIIHERVPIYLFEAPALKRKDKKPHWGTEQTIIIAKAISTHITGGLE